MSEGISGFTEGSVMAKAVLVKDAYKRYSENGAVLSGLNMAVDEGTIYGLLGPSGCGKTTLLGCIVGRKILDYGEIQLSVTKKSEMGYMPQEIALNMEMNIAELFNFYGRIHEMKQSYIERRGKELLALLDLPCSDKWISQCSGGQQRRISLAVSLLHNPKLIILDEPTVGIDPLLCQRIWEYFVMISSDMNKTIIITTHYIEEARHANTIGLMRGGRILAEDSPEQLITVQGTSSLEEAFLKLSQQQEMSQEEENYYPDDRPPAKLSLIEDNEFSGGRLMAQLHKNYNWMLRNRMVTLLSCFLLPTSLLITGSYTVRDAVKPPLAAASKENCDYEGSLNISALGCPPIYRLSCVYLALLAANYPIKRYSNAREAEAAVHQGKAFSYLYFPDNFTYHFLERIDWQVDTLDESVEGSTLQVKTDMTQFLLSYQLIEDLYSNMVKLMGIVLAACRYNHKLATTPITVQEYVYGSLEDSRISAYVPGFITSIVFYTSFIYTSTAIMMEKGSGLLERAQISGLTIKEVLTAQFIIQFVLATFSNIVSLITLYGIEGFKMNGSWISLYIILTLAEVLGTIYGVLLSLIFKQENLVAYAGIGTVLGLFMTTGSLWPREGMHWMLAKFSNLMPISLSAWSYFNISVRGWGFFSHGVIPGAFAMVFAAFILVIISIILLKLKIATF